MNNSNPIRLGVAKLSSTCALIMMDHPSSHISKFPSTNNFRNVTFACTCNGIYSIVKAFLYIPTVTFD